MPLYDFVCEKCNQSREVLTFSDSLPECCGEVMTRLYSGTMTIKMGYPSWINKMDDIHKEQEEKGERLRFVHPSEVLKA